jgi:hypothetical protein
MNKDKKFIESIKKLQEGEEEEFAKVKSNESKSLLGNNLVPEKILSLLSWTVSFWMSSIENNEIKTSMLPTKKLVKFCRLILEQGKNEGYLKDYNRADVRILKMLALANSSKASEIWGKEQGLDYQSLKKYEKKIGYN